MSTQIESLMTVEDLDLFPDDGNRYELHRRSAPPLCHAHLRLEHQIMVGNAFFEYPYVNF